MHAEVPVSLRSWMSARCSPPCAALGPGCTVTLAAGPAAAGADGYVHPDTVAYRLPRIEALTGRSLRRADTRMELHLALTVRDAADLGPGRDERGVGEPAGFRAAQPTWNPA